MISYKEFFIGQDLCSLLCISHTVPFCLHYFISCYTHQNERADFLAQTCFCVAVWNYTAIIKNEYKNTLFFTPQAASSAVHLTKISSATRVLNYATFNGPHTTPCLRTRTSALHLFLCCVTPVVQLRPDEHVRKGVNTAGIEGGATLSLPRGIITQKDALGRNTFLVKNAKGVFVNLTLSRNTSTRIEITGNASDVMQGLGGLSYSVPATAGQAIADRQRTLRVYVKVVAADRTPYTATSPYVDGTTTCTVSGCKCKIGLNGPACDTMRYLDIIVSVNPRDVGRRVIPSTSSQGGRRGILNRGGHGTHTTLIVGGIAYDGTPNKLKATEYNTLATAAYVVFVDIGNSDNAYLTPPESIGDELMDKPYKEANARVFLNPWTCEDFSWWKKQDQDFDPAASVPQDKAYSSLPSICNR
jgi:hypothetical protein